MNRASHLRRQEVPEVPVGTPLALRGDEWSHCAAVQPGRYLDITVSRVHRNVLREEGGHLWVWVAGHRRPTCGWESVEPHKPCLQLLVRVDALVRAVSPADM